MIFFFFYSALCWPSKASSAAITSLSASSTGNSSPLLSPTLNKEPLSQDMQECQRESVLFLPDSLGTQGSFTVCWCVLVVQRADWALPPRHEHSEARLEDTKEVKARGFAWQVNAADVPVQKCSVSTTGTGLIPSCRKTICSAS